MRFLEIKDKKRYNAFVKKIEHSQFLQSWQWGEFQERLGKKVIRVGVEDKGELKAAATIIKNNIGFGRGYFYSPRGPVIDHRSVCGKDARECRLENAAGIEAYNTILGGIKEMAEKERAIFYRFEPTCSGQTCPFASKSDIDIQPKETIILELSSSEEEILSAMHQKTRYNIRLAQRKEVSVKEARFADRFDDFWNIMTMTRERDRFRTHSYEYYKKMLNADDCSVKLFVAELYGKLLSAGIFSFFGDTATYIHGASSNENRQVMAPYLLQWQVIKTAKKAGFKYYDLYGVDEEKWPGVTRFKKGFRGSRVVYPGTFDIVYKKILYRSYQIARRARRRI